MNNPYRLIGPSPGWARLLWPADHAHELDVKLALSAISLIPGCQLGDRYLEVPHTAWMLDCWDALLDTVKLTMRHTQLPKAPNCQMMQAARTLYDFQEVGVDKILTEGQLLLADEMGLGKTTQAAVAAESIRRDSGRTAVIVAPLIVRGTWKQELLALGAIEDEDQFCALETRDLDHPSFRKHGVRYYFIHYDITRAWWSQLQMLGSRRPIVAIVDEAHIIRNKKTHRAQGTEMLAGLCPFRILCTGTPLENRPGDLWNLLTLTTGTRTWGGPLDFRKRYAGAFNNGYGWQDSEPTHVDELQKRIEPFYLRRTVSEVKLQLPPLTRSAFNVDFDKKSQKQHDSLINNVSLDQLVRAVASGAVREVLPVLTQLRQLTSLAKMEATVDLVHSLLDQEQSAVVFCWEREMVHKLVSWIDGHTVAVEGSMPQDDRDAQIRRFQSDSRPMVMVATLDSMQMGVTLHRARTVVMHDLHWKLSTLLQAEKRIHRIGQRNACQSIWMIADKSIDTILAPILMRKATMMKDLLGIEAGAEVADDVGFAELNESGVLDAQLALARKLWSEK